MRYLRTVVGVVVIVLLALACSHLLNQPSESPPPARDTAPSYSELLRALEDVLAERGLSIATATVHPPLSDRSRVNTFRIQSALEGAASLAWSCRNEGDYNLDGETNISDLTPIGLYWHAHSTDSLWLRASVADGDENLEVNISDITPIGRNFLSLVEGYVVQTSPSSSADAVWEEAQTVVFDSSVLHQADGYRAFTATIAGAIVGNYYRVVPYMEDGAARQFGVASNAVRFTFTAAPTGLQASDGEYIDHISVTWNKVAGAEHYLVYRDADGYPLYILGDVDAWDDTAVPTYGKHSYTVCAQSNYGLSAHSNSDDGYLKTDSLWPMFRHDVQRTGRTSAIGPATPSVKWEYEAGFYLGSSPAISSSNMVCWNTSWSLTDNPPESYRTAFLLNSDGSKKWSFVLSQVSYSSNPSITSLGTCYFSTYDGNVCSITNDGSLKWQKSLSGKQLGDVTIALDGGLYVVGSSYDVGLPPAERRSGWLYALTPYGDLIWTYEMKGIAIGAPSIDSDGTIYFGSIYDEEVAGSIYAINPDGSQKWRLQSGYGYWFSPAVGDDGTLYVGGQTDPGFHVIAIHPDGSIKWSYDSDNSANYSSTGVSLGLDGTIYIGMYFQTYPDTGALYAFDSDGNLKWSFPVDAGVWCTPAVDGNGTIYFGCDNHKLYAVNPDGSELWSYTCTDRVTGGLAIGPDGTLYAASIEGHIYAFNDH